MTTTEQAAPAWAVHHETDVSRVRYIRRASAKPTGIDDFGKAVTAEPMLIREDEFVISDDGATSVRVGRVQLYVGDLAQLDVDQAPVLVAAITELLDALEAGGPR
jgi:hypothetical protein